MTSLIGYRNFSVLCTCHVYIFVNVYFFNLDSLWDEFPENKLHKIFPVLKECIVCPRTNRKEETVMARLHIGHSFITHSFLLKGEEPPVCIGCDKSLTIEHYFTYLFGFY